MSIILISNCKDLTIITLLDVVHLYVNTVILSLEYHVVLNKMISLEFKMFVFIVYNSDTVLGVVGDDHLNYIHLCIDKGSKCKILEEFTVFIELL